jgi:ligand-binding SRPBCC domain-containing protein
VTPRGGLPVRWVTEITHLVEGKLFVDEQRAGPYRMWHHEHHFREVEGGVEMRDLLHYALPAGGGVAHRWMVAPRPKQIFDYRREFLARTFGEPTP